MLPILVAGAWREARISRSCAAEPQVRRRFSKAAWHRLPQSGRKGKPSACRLTVTARNWPNLGALSASRGCSLAKQGASDDGSGTVPGVAVPGCPARNGAPRGSRGSALGRLAGTGLAGRVQVGRLSRMEPLERELARERLAVRVKRRGPGRERPRHSRRSGRHLSTALPPVISRVHALCGCILRSEAGGVDTVTTRGLFRIKGPSRPA